MNSIAEKSLMAGLYHEVEQRFAAFRDPAHGWEHIERVYKLSLQIADAEGADQLITGIAALLHDLGRLSHQKGKHHSELSVAEARPLLENYALSSEQIEAILHAIAAHSFSKGQDAESLEALCVRDADRLDALGAIGIMRWAMTSVLKQKDYTLTYHPDDPFGTRHELDDKKYRLDHFSIKLLRLTDTMGTRTGRDLAQRRTAFMRAYLEEFKSELD
jgi:uncharacterized protein